MIAKIYQKENPNIIVSAMNTMDRIEGNALTGEKKIIEASEEQKTAKYFKIKYCPIIIFSDKLENLIEFSEEFITKDNPLGRNPNYMVDCVPMPRPDLEGEEILDLEEVKGAVFIQDDKKPE